MFFIKYLPKIYIFLNLFSPSTQRKKHLVISTNCFGALTPEQRARKSNPRLFFVPQMRVSFLLMAAIMMMCVVVGSAAPQRFFSWPKFFKRRARLRPRGGRGRGCTDSGLGIVSCRWSVALMDSPRVSHQDDPCWLRLRAPRGRSWTMRSWLGCRPPRDLALPKASLSQPRLWRTSGSVTPTWHTASGAQEDAGQGPSLSTSATDKGGAEGPLEPRVASGRG